VVFVFVYPLWTLVATAFFRRLAQLGHLMNVPSHPTAGKRLGGLAPRSAAACGTRSSWSSSG